MANPKENIQIVNDLIEEVKSHPMCLRFCDDPCHYLVLYPAGFRLDGTRASKDGGKAIALKRLLDAMELHWQDKI